MTSRNHPQMPRLLTKLYHSSLRLYQIEIYARHCDLYLAHRHYSNEICALQNTHHLVVSNDNRELQTYSMKFSDFMIATRDESSSNKI